MTIRLGAVSAAVCGLLIPGLVAGSYYLARRFGEFVAEVGRAQDIETSSDDD